MFLDPILKGEYPEDLLRDLEPLTDLSHIREGDLEEIAAPLDLLGVNYYHPLVARRSTDVPSEPPMWPGSEDIRVVSGGTRFTDMGWGIVPGGLTELLVSVHETYGPIPMVVTENGAAFQDVVTEGRVHDPQRVRYLDGHVRAASRAIARGVDLRGYLVWSLLDNFEWSEGFARRFGLVYVDYATQERDPQGQRRVVPARDRRRRRERGRGRARRGDLRGNRSDQDAGGAMILAGTACWVQLGIDRAASILGHRASGMEPAARRQVDRVRRLALEDLRLRPVPRVALRNDGQQGFRVRVLRVAG